MPEHSSMLVFMLIAVGILALVDSQRPLLNHTTIGISPEQQNNYLCSGKQLRNGRMYESASASAAAVAAVKPTISSASGFQRAMLHYDDLEDINPRLPPQTTATGNSNRRDNRRKPMNTASLGLDEPGTLGSMQRPSYPRRGIDSLRRELMKPSVGGPGGGISVGVGYPSYSATSSIGKIDGLGSLGPADRYGDQLRPAAAVLSTRFPPHFLPDATFDDKPIRASAKKNSISEIMKMNNDAKAQRFQRFPQHGQADEPAGGVTHGNIDDDDEHDDPIQAIKEKMKQTGPKPGAYETNTEGALVSSEIEDQLGVKCTFETPCAWKWTENLPDGFQILSGAELAKKNLTGLLPGPVADSVDDANGHFLYARLLPTTAQVNLTSPQFSTTMEKCFLEVYMHQSDMSHGLSRVVVEPLHSQESAWVPAEIAGDNFRQWSRKFYRLGRISREFRIVFEVVPKLSGQQKGHVALDNLRMVNCFPEGTKAEKCSISQVKCMMNKVPVCIPLPRICDITKDCDDAEDELLNCDQIPYGGRCDFENDWCGWRDSGNTVLAWSRHTGSSPTSDTGPDGDHTQQHLLNATGGYYMLVNMNQHSNNSEKGRLIGFASKAIMISKTFNPPPLVHGNPNSPYRNSCVVRFYIHQFGKNPGSINLSVVEIKEKENITTTLWWSTKNQGSDWLRAEYVLPNITSKYYLQFEARMGMRIYSDVAVDDFSLSPECFGLNIPKEHLNGYNYWNVRHNVKSPPHRDFEQKNYLELTSCDTRGMIGPSQQQCEVAYKANNKTQILKEIRVVEEQSSYKGMQKWKVPNEGYYTIIAKGASGGLGSGGVGSSRGAVAVAVLSLLKNEELFILVGQQGENACIKSMSFKEEGCGNDDDEHDLDLSKYSFSSKQHMVKNIHIENGAGGGGGGSYIFLLNSAKNEAVPLVVAGGGGGLGIGQFIDEDFQHGQKANPIRPGVTGQIHGESLNKKTAGAGGGWRAEADRALSAVNGAALLQGGRGGHSCYYETNNNGTTVKRHGQGGFGGGGGGCYTGGGGGGYAGGDVYLNESNGEGGTSYITNSRSLKDFNAIYDGANSGPGSVIIIPAIEGCGCDFRCIALDEFRAAVRCICPDGWRLRRDNSTACEFISDDHLLSEYLVAIFSILILLLLIAFTALVCILYNRIQRKRQAKLRHKMLLEQDLQLSRLRQNIDDINLPNFNLNYGCDNIISGHIDVKSLPQVARESLRLVKALGQGAFGEVYQGLYRHRDGDAVEMPVAVKTLPELSTKQSEDDFLMEAAIMAKFNHPNMVHLIGVCFDRHPRFIVLELLAGGDLKNFLREGRSKPERPSPLTMKDLVFCALDVAKGCRYMESKRFIHRDIAARNCLLSSKGPGRVVKIADFGMARDIYRSDYYRKGGKAMLPIKWMPPEAFLDGIFTSKTDVWSFGVLLWEVFSMGLMPYTGMPNPEVMQLVTNGGRLGCPAGCPAIIYRIMADCWNPTPEDRPTFSVLLERLTACTQDPDVMNAPLPNIFRPQSVERDQTIMRPPGGDEFCLPVPHSSDYLVPLPSHITNGDEYATTSSALTATTLPMISSNNCTPPAVSSPTVPRAGNGEHDDDDEEDACWETSFIISSSKSDQPLLGSGGVGAGAAGSGGNINVAATNHSDSQRSINGLHAAAAVAAGRLSGNASGYSSSTSQRSPIMQANQHQNQKSSMNAMPMTNGDIKIAKQDATKAAASTTSTSTSATGQSEDKLISLDTPQPTPTTIQPPLSFSSQLDGITLDPSALTKNLHSNSSSPGSSANKSYANIQMMSSVVGAGAQKLPNGNANCTELQNEKLLLANGGLPNGNATAGNGSLIGSGNGNGNNGVANPPPFTIQGFSDRYKDAHSEINC